MHRALSPPHPNPLLREAREKYAADAMHRSSSLPLPLQLQFCVLAAALWSAFQIPLVSAAEPSAPAAQSSSTPSTPEPATSNGPEYRTRAMPTDTFKPSEKVSEDYPIAFPADI